MANTQADQGGKQNGTSRSGRASQPTNEPEKKEFNSKRNCLFFHSAKKKIELAWSFIDTTSREEIFPRRFFFLLLLFFLLPFYLHQATRKLIKMPRLFVSIHFSPLWPEVFACRVIKLIKLAQGIASNWEGDLLDWKGRGERDYRFDRRARWSLLALSSHKWIYKCSVVSWLVTPISKSFFEFMTTCKMQNSA